MNIKPFANTMSVPPAPPQVTRVQQSPIHPFFQPRTPKYAPPQGGENTTTSPIPVLSAHVAIPSAISSNTREITAIPQQATISHVDSSHIQPLRRINSLLLPVNYPDSFYHQIVDPSSTPSFSRVILWQDSPSSPLKVVGGIVCRLDPSLAPDSTSAAPNYIEGYSDIYVQSLALLSPYRGYGLAAAALQSVIDAAAAKIRLRIAGLYAHVWTENSDALDWYAARGFQKEEPVINGYYKRLKPDSAWILKRRFSIMDHLTNPTPGLASSPPEETASSPTATATPSAIQNPASRPLVTPRTASFQDRRPDREWNDLPEDVLGDFLLKPPSGSNSKSGSAASSRSSSRSAPKKRKERLYPAAAFGS